MAAGLSLGWQIDLEDLGNEHGKPKIQPCNAYVSSSMALCVWPCNCYGPRSDHQPELLWDLDLYSRLARADAWAFIGPINWYGPTSNFKLLFDRLVCMNGGNPRPDLIDKKSTVLAQALERSSLWRELSKNHLEGRSAGFCYGDRGGADLDAGGRPEIFAHKEWFDPKDEPYDNERNAYQSLVWQSRYSGMDVLDLLWSYADIGVGKLYADTQADSLENEPAALAAFDEWTRGFVTACGKQGNCERRRCGPPCEVHDPMSENRTHDPAKQEGGAPARRNDLSPMELPLGIGVSQTQEEGKAMARYSRSASTNVKRAMNRRKAGMLKSGRSGKIVKSKKQAIAIGISEARAKGKKVPRRKSA
jgi:Family of unknown function (DUF6496)/NADPH-dependent FMN reductase